MFMLCNKKKVPPFYIDLLCAWCEIRYIEVTDIPDIGNEILWFNSNFKFKREVLFFKKWFEHDIVFVNQLSHNYCWKSTASVHQMLDCKSLLIDFEFLKLKKAIPNEWLRKGIEANTKVIEEDYYVIRNDTVKLMNMKTKDFYTNLVKLKKSGPSILQYWQYKLGLPPDFEWIHVLQFKLKYLKHNKIKQFNFKMLHNLLPFKMNLCRWKLSTDTSCMFCEAEETFDHIMLHCLHVSNFWIKVSEFLQSSFRTNLLINKKVLFIGHQIQDKNFSLINMIIIFAQFAIYKSYIMYKLHGKPFHVLSIWQVFKYEIS